MVAAVSASSLAAFAHELRAPLGGIAAMVEMLERSNLDAEQARIVRALKASAEHLGAVAGSVLGQTAAEVRPEDRVALLATFIAGFAPSLEARAASRGLGSRLVIGPGLDAARVADAVGLRQVLENLVDNACRLSERGALVVTIADAPPGRLRFSVADEGPGITAEEARRLIAAGGGIAGRKGGAGLGLRISGQLVARHGGRLAGGPNPAGQGAEFGFDWPCAPAASGERRSGADAADAPACCLIVDDHPASRLVLATILSAAGYACREAGAVEAAVRIIAAERPDIVLTDLNMPGGHGSMLIERIAGMPPALRPRVLVVSADEIDGRHPLESVIDGAIRKPISVRAVLDAVGRTCARAGNRAA